MKLRIGFVGLLTFGVTWWLIQTRFISSQEKTEIKSEITQIPASTITQKNIPVHVALHASAEIFGPMNKPLVTAISNTLLIPETNSLTHEELVQKFEQLGFTIKDEIQDNKELGQRLIAHEDAPFAGIFNINIQHTRDAQGKEYFEGIRFSFSPQDDSFAYMAENWQKRARTNWKQIINNEKQVMWSLGEGTVLWMKEYTDEAPSPRPGLRNAVRVGLETTEE